MAKGQPSPQGQAVLDIKRQHPDYSPTEIAEELGIRPNSVYQAETRLRDAGHLPRLRPNKRGRKRGRTPVPTVPSGGGPPLLDLGEASNGPVVNGSVEDHVRVELREGIERIRELEARKVEVDNELETRRQRQSRLEKAQEALTA